MIGFSELLLLNVPSEQRLALMNEVADALGVERMFYYPYIPLQMCHVGDEEPSPPVKIKTRYDHECGVYSEEFES